MTISENIRRLRTERNLSQEQLAELLEVSRQSVSKWETAKANPDMDKIMQIFDETKAWNLPVVDGNGRYVGFMSKSKIFNSYREVLVENFSGD